MEGLLIPLVLVVAFVGVVIPLMIRSVRRTNEAWAGVARRLDLRATPASFGQKRRIGGRLGGIAVRVDTFTKRHGKSSTTYTRFRAEFPRSLGLGLQLTSEGFLTGLSKIFGAQDVQTGQPGFDDAVLVKGADPQRVVEFLTEARRARIQRFLASHSGAEITDSGVRWHRRGVLRDHAALASAIRETVAVARGVLEGGEGDEFEDPTLAAQEKGRLEDSYSLFVPPVVAEVEPEIVEIELMTEVDVEELREERPDALLEEVEAPPAAPRVADGPPSPVSVGAGASTSAAPDELELTAVCATLFHEGALSYEIDQRFAGDFRGKAARGSGRLTRVEAYAYDFVFDGKDGARATFELGETAAGAYGSRKVVAIVQLPRAAAAELKGSVGRTLVFHGTLVKVDGFLRHVFLASGRVEPA